MTDTNLLWTPSQTRIENATLTAFMHAAEKQTGMVFKNYEDVWRWSVSDLPDFWSLVWDFCGITGEKGARIAEEAADMRATKFFPDAQLSFAENMLKRRDAAEAIAFFGENKIERRLSFADLYNDVSKLRQVLLDAGVQQGDRVAGFLPNMPEAVIGLLAANSIGAVWSSASPDFGVQGVLDRFGQIEPKVLITVDAYLYNGKVVDCLGKLAEIIPQLPSLKTTLVVPYAGEKGAALPQGAVNYRTALDTKTAGDIPFVRLPFNHPLMILYSSGTTGIPKCIVHGQGGTLIQHMKEHQLQSDVKAGDRVFYFTTTGWMMWNWLVSALASGASLLLYDGSPFFPRADRLFDLADAEGMTLFGTAAKYIDALKKLNVRPKDTHTLSTVRTLTSTGSPLVHESFRYIYDAIKTDLHVSSLSGGTDIVSCFVIGNPISPVYAGEIQGAGLGYAMDVYDDAGNPIPAGGGQGEMVCTKPFPTMPIYFWNDADGARYKAAYFERFENIWCHGDWMERTPHNGFIITGRSDATLKPGGVRIGTAEIYRQVEQVPEVLESLAVGQDWDNDVRIVLFVKLREGVGLDTALADRLKQVIRTGASPRHVPAKIIAVTDLPRTKSGKLVELAVRDMIHGKPVRNKEALANPEALDLFVSLPDLAA